MALWNGIGQVANIAQQQLTGVLIGVDAYGLISMIVEAAKTVKRNQETCQLLARRVRMIGDLMQQLQSSQLMQHVETRNPMEQLEETLRHAYMLVASCGDRNYLHSCFTGGQLAEQLRQVQEEINFYLQLFPIVGFVDNARTYERGRNTDHASCSEVHISNLHPNSAAENNNNNGSPNGSRARAQLSCVITRQRSGPSWFRVPAEEFTFAQLDAATKGFTLETKIREASFGTVHRGKLPDGREVAIKRTKRRSYQEKESAFWSELAFLSRLHHKHLVGLVGYCNEDDERMLVYEYMKNGALFDHLHPKASASSSSPLSSPVMSSWKLRIKILLDASRGIEYLHSYAVPPIIHRDIKSSNILLDASWTARVSDFSLSLMGPSEAEPHQLQGRGGMVVKAAGTVGYMDPEYYGLHHLTTKSDVFHLGVVMLETLTGKRAIFRDDHAATDDDSSPVVSSVVQYAVPAIVKLEHARVLDPRAPVPAQPNEAEAVELVAYTAVNCVRIEGKDRPAMADIVANLETAFTLCKDSDRGAGGFGNSSSSASLSVTSMDRSGAL